MKALNKFILQLTAVVFGVMLAGAAMAQSNDLCTGAIAVTCGQTVTGNTTASTIDAPPACGLTFPRYGIWYSFAGTGQTVTLSTCSATTNFDTQIGVFSGSCTALTCVAGNNDDYTCASNNRNSTVTFTSAPGVTYYIWVTGKLSSRGAFSMSVACTGGVFSGCTNTTSFGSATINTSGTLVTISSCSYAGEYSTISGAAAGQTLRFTSSNAADFITIHSGTPSGPIVAFGATPLQFSNTFTGTLYAHWNLANCGAQSTCRTTTVQCTSCTPPPPPPPSDNDACSATVPLITCGSSPQGSTSAATLDAVGTCVTALNTAPGVWYRFIGTGQTVSISTCNAFTNYDTKLGVFTGTCGALTCVTGNDDATCAISGLRSLVTFATTSGTTYYILVTGFSTASGNFQLDVTCTTPLLEGVNNNPVEVANVGKLHVGEFFPNPAQFDNTNVKIYSPNESNARIVLFDNVGRAVHNQEVELYSGENNVELQLNNLAIGTYFAAINVNGETIHKKLVIVR